MGDDRGSMWAAMGRFTAAAVGSGIAEVSTLPVDIAKVRLQTQKVPKDGTPRMYKNMFHAGYTVAKAEGPAALWKGLTPALIRQCSYTGLTFMMYEPMRNFIAGEGVKMEEIGFFKRVAAGGMAGGLSIFMVNPADVLKIRAQNSKMGSQSLASVAAGIYKQNGVRGLWTGWSPNVARSFVGNACEVGCYDYFKSNILKNGWAEEGPVLHLLASFGSGTVSAFCSTPFDVTKTRVMAQAGKVSTKNEVMYKGVVDCFVRIAREEGATAFYKGFAPLAVRKVVWTVIYFLAYEQVLKVTCPSS